jgi:alkylation response protein AidB-like acyl-CoA dehydrogenase
MSEKSIMHLAHLYASAESLEQALGNPLDPACIFSFKRAVECDEHDAYPEDACALLTNLGFQEHYIPTSCGGKQRNFDELLILLRIVARRDFTVAWAHGVNTILGTAAVWVGGSQQQKLSAAHLIKSGKTVAVAYHEQTHGNDLLANEVRAELNQESQKYEFTGEKWVIGNATRGAALTLFARTVEGGGPRDFSLFFLDKDNLDHDRYRLLPSVKTHGIRGADVSGIRFNRCSVSGKCLIGSLGSGLEMTLKSFQVTRTIMPALSLGAADTLLRSTMRFVSSRHLYGNTVFSMPTVQKHLVDAFIDLLICECVSIAAARSLHVMPEQMSVSSAVAKYFIPTVADGIARNLTTLLGARHFLRHEHDFGIFQKMLRDQACVSIGHVGASVNLAAIAQQLRQLAGEHVSARRPQFEQMVRLESVFKLDETLPEFDGSRLALLNRGQDYVIQGLGAVRDSLKTLSEEQLQGEEVITILALTDDVIEKLDACAQRALVLSECAGETSVELMDLARRYCYGQAAAICLQIWWHNRSEIGGFFASGEWLALALDRLLREMRAGIYSCPHHFVAKTADALNALYLKDKLFSIMPIQLACHTME